MNTNGAAATNPNGSNNSNGSNNRKRGRTPQRSTGGKAPRKMLSQKESKLRMRQLYYEDKKKTGRISEQESQTYPSTSDAQTQDGASFQERSFEKTSKDASSQTNFHSRFYDCESDCSDKGSDSD